MAFVGTEDGMNLLAGYKRAANILKKEEFAPGAVNPAPEPAEAARLAEAGLMRLYDTLEAHVHKLRKQHPDLVISFNATGGFKAETAILYGLGCDLGIPVYYLHETYKVPIVLPVCAVPF